MDLPLDLIPLLAAFDAGEVRFLVVGGHAVSIHSRPRYTKDLDLWLALKNKEAVGRPQDRRDVRELRGRPESKKAKPRRR